MTTAAWRNRIGRVWHSHLGRPAWVALALAVGVAVLQWRMLPALESEHLRLEDRLLKLPAKVAAAATTSTATDSAVRAPAGLELPPGSQRARDTEVLVDAALRNGLVLERADYTLATPNAGAASRLQATLPLTGTYSSLRRYVAAVLNALPHAALESLSIERADAQATQLQATAHLVLFYRAEDR